MRTVALLRAVAVVSVRVSVCVAAVAAVAGCSSAPSRSDSELAIAASVRVEAEGCSVRPAVGAGAFVADHLVLTVAHVVAGATDVDVVLADGTEKLASVVAIDRRRDIAVLRVDADTSPLPRGSMRAGATGVFVSWRASKPGARPFTARAFVDITASDIDRGGGVPRRGYELIADVLPGDSGSVLVSDGRAVAVVFAHSSRHRDRAWATDIREAAVLIDTAGNTAVDVGGCLAR
jgi:S1-C subfamily serine protease